jgi:hypothetical protein
MSTSRNRASSPCRSIARAPCSARTKAAPTRPASTRGLEHDDGRRMGVARPRIRTYVFDHQLLLDGSAALSWHLYNWCRQGRGARERPFGRSARRRCGRTRRR